MHGVGFHTAKNLFLPNMKFKPVTMEKIKIPISWNGTKNAYSLQQPFII